MIAAARGSGQQRGEPTADSLQLGARKTFFMPVAKPVKRDKMLEDRRGENPEMERLVIPVGRGYPLFSPKRRRERSYESAV